MREIGDYKNLKKIEKSTTGLFGFHRTAADITEFLDGRKIKDLVVSGANGGACVHCSIEGALDNGYRVWTDSAAIIDFNSSEFQYPYIYAEERLSLLFSENVSNFNQVTSGEIEDLLRGKKRNHSPSRCDGDLRIKDYPVNEAS